MGISKFRLTDEEILANKHEHKFSDYIKKEKISKKHKECCMQENNNLKEKSSKNITCEPEKIKSGTKEDDKDICLTFDAIDKIRSDGYYNLAFNLILQNALKVANNKNPKLECCHCNRSLSLNCSVCNTYNMFVLCIDCNKKRNDEDLKVYLNDMAKK